MACQEVPNRAGFDSRYRKYSYYLVFLGGVARVEASGCVGPSQDAIWANPAIFAHQEAFKLLISMFIDHLVK